MRLNILIGGKAGQGINKISGIVADILSKHGYFIFNYRDYPSLIRGGHNFNILSISDEKIGSFESRFDGIISLDDKTLELHKNELKDNGFIVSYESFEEHKINLNMALAGALTKILGLDLEVLLERIRKEFEEESVEAAKRGYESQEKKYDFERIDRKISIISGSHAVTLGAINSKVKLYISYPMTPATGVLHELATKQSENDFIVFQPENEIAAVNSALGASFTGTRAMVGTSGGGFDLMSEALSFQGQSEIPLVIYLASRPGPGTGVPTYTLQADLNAALGSGHGEFSRIVVAPGDPIEAIEKTNEAFYLSEKFKTLVIILSDKHLAEGEFSLDNKPNEFLDIRLDRKIPGDEIVKVSSYEHDEFGNTTEDSSLIVENTKRRIGKSEEIKKELEKFEAVKVHGDKESKNLVIGFGSTKGVVLDSIKGLDVKFLQVLYLEPFSDRIEEEIKKAEKVILVELNSTGQLGRLVKEKTGIDIKEKVLKYDGRPFASDELRKEIEIRL
ncbi:pyruvate ferredoxin oxidoreductase [Candidatus Pacearchaeota archaeon]|nr:pyruvate ferredoxin oxidoreductase [Candidatus Pacearchaeota archaeon]